MQIQQTNGEYGIYDSENEEVILTGVKELFGRAYLTINDEFLMLSNNEDIIYEPVEDVFKYYGDQLIWTKDKKLYKIDGYHFNESRNAWECSKFKISDNVKQISEDDYYVYISEDNGIYLMGYHFIPEKIGEVNKNVKQITRYYYLTTENELYTIDGTKYAENIKKIMYNEGQTYFITNNNELCLIFEGYDENDNEYELIVSIDDNIQDVDFDNRIIYYRKNNIVYNAIYNEEENKVEKTKLFENVKKYNLLPQNGINSYITQDNALCKSNGTVVTEDVVDGYANEYQGYYVKSDGSIYFMYKEAPQMPIG